MLKKIILVLLGFIFLMPKQIVAVEPITIGLCCGLFTLAGILDNDFQERRGKEKLEKEKLEKENCHKAYEAGKAANEKNQQNNDFKVKVQLASEEHGHILITSSLEKIKAEETFRKCLINNIHNSDLGLSRIPKICEDSAKVLRLLGRSSEVDKLIADFQK